MIDGDERLAEGEGECLGAGEPDEERADEPRAVANGDGVELVEGDSGVGESAADGREEALGVGAGGDFGDDAVILRVQVVLAGNDRGEHAAGADDHRRGGLVA